MLSHMRTRMDGTKTEKVHNMYLVVLVSLPCTRLSSTNQRGGKAVVAVGCLVSAIVLEYHPVKFGMLQALVVVPFGFRLELILSGICC